MWSRKSILIAGSFLLAGLLAGVVLFRASARSDRGTVNVSFTSLSSEANGERLATFYATNGTKRLFVRGSSEVELQGIMSNSVTRVQITNVDYLWPGQATTFSVRCPAPGRPWRLNFFYIGQRSRMENLEEDVAWFLYRQGWQISEANLRRAPVRNISTEWIDR